MAVRFRIPAVNLMSQAEDLTEVALGRLTGDPAVPKHVILSVRRALRRVRRAVADMENAALAGPVAWCEACGSRLELLRRERRQEAWIAACSSPTCAAYGVRARLSASGKVIAEQMPARTGIQGA